MSDALFRLAGDGDRAAGGAIPLPDAFTAVLEELMSSPATYGTLKGRISDIMRYCEPKIMTAAWRSWDQYTSDILLCLSEDMQLITENSTGKWELTHKFVPDYPFPFPGLSKVIAIGRSPEKRQSRIHNEQVLRELQPILALIKSEASGVNLAVRQLLIEAEKVLVKELAEPELPPPTRYRQNNPREPHEQGKRIRVGLTAFFRDEFWKKYAKPGEWYSLTEVSEVFNRTHPGQPPIDHADLTGSMRKEGRDMVAAGKLESKKVPEKVEGGKVVRKWKFRIPVPTTPGYGPNAAIVPVRTRMGPATERADLIVQLGEKKPAIRWDEIRREARSDPKA